MSGRIEARFAKLKAEARAGLVTFITAGDPDQATSLAILRQLPAAGADLIELGMPFTDPMAEGPTIQASYLRALQDGATMQRTFDLVRAFRKEDAATPIALMGYYNPIYSYGPERFIKDALAAGVDGMIVVDLTPEEDGEFCVPALRAGLNFIRLTAPTTDDKRLPAVLAHTAGFIYYVSLTGITGVGTPDLAAVASAVERLHRHSSLPVAVGFGIRTAEQAGAIARVADAVVVGSALVNQVAMAKDRQGAIDGVLGLVRELAAGVRQARKPVAAE